MAKNYVLLQQVELTKTAASITFNNLPQTGFTDLKIVMSARGDGASGSFICQFNGTTTNLSSKVLYGINGSAVGSGSYSDENSIWGYTTNSGSTANTFNNAEILIPKYTSNNNKSVSIDAVNETNASDGRQIITAGLWSSTAAITSITLYSKTGSNVATNFTQYSTFSIYGLAAYGTTPTTAPKATGGNSILSDGTYWYHTFTSSGMFIPKTTLSCDVLAIAGGGSGSGGGGGAGGVVYHSGRSVSSRTTAMVGAGGTSGSKGNQTTFDTITCNGGGAGGYDATNGPGGSGGGNDWSHTSTVAATQGNSGGGTGYGNVGGAGSGVAGNGYAAGGGGGAGGAGSAGVSGTSGNGGAGLNTWSSWASVTGTGVSGYYAGGGGGGIAGSATRGTGGSGGGGAGGATDGSQTGSAGTANTGSGGGGRGVDYYSGGSGIIIIRYAV